MTTVFWWLENRFQSANFWKRHPYLCVNFKKCESQVYLFTI